MRINTNVAALNSYNQLKNTQNNLSKSLSRLSSGKRINGAADDAAGLAISEKMGSQTRGLAQAQRNAQDGISMIQTAEGALKESHSILQRMRELSVQSANDTNTEADRGEIQKEVDQLAQELTRIGETTEFNTQNLLDGTLDDTKFQIGANEGQNMTVAINDMRANALGVEGGAEGLELDTQAETGASAATEALVEGNAAITGTATSYTVEQLDENVTIAAADMDASTSDVEAGYGIQNADGDYVGIVSDDGQSVYIADAAQSNIGDLNFDHATADALEDATVSLTGSASLTDGSEVELHVASNALELSTDDAIATFTNEDNTLASGDYKVVDSNYHGVTNSGLVNSSGDLVATSDGSDPQGWSDLEGNELFKANLTDGDTYSISGGKGIDVSSQNAANNAISTLDDAIANVSAERSKLGAVQNRLDHTINNLNTAEENLTAAESRISDVDMAKEMMNMSKQQILSQAGTAMMAQANQLPQGVLQLLG